MARWQANGVIATIMICTWMRSTAGRCLNLALVNNCRGAGTRCEHEKGKEESDQYDIFARKQHPLSF